MPHFKGLCMIKKILYFLFIMLFYGCNLFEIPVNVYFCGGQSNANIIWYEAIKSEILKVDSNAVVVHSFHSGHAIHWWIDNNIPKLDYYEDLQSIYNAVNNKNYNIKAFFWFQGEGDRYYDAPELYENRFNDLINNFKKDTDDDFLIFLTIVDEYPVSDGIEQIRIVQKNIINKSDQIYGIDSRGYERRDPVHLAISEYIRIGNNISDIAMQLLF